MNVKSAVPDETHLTLTLSRLQVNKWFNDNNGKETSPKEKPFDTPKLIKERFEWVHEWYEKLTDPSTPVAYLDEKWFYATNRRRKLKRLPKGKKRN